MNPNMPRPAAYRNAAPYIGSNIEILDDGKSTLMLDHRDGDQYVIRSYPGGHKAVTRDTGWEAAAFIRTLPAGSSWEVLHVRDGGTTEVARYWPVTVIDCAG